MFLQDIYKITKKQLKVNNLKQEIFRLLKVLKEG